MSPIVATAPLLLHAIFSAVRPPARDHGPMTVHRMGRAQALSRQFVQRMTDDAAGLHLLGGIDMD
ncbi:hypothetical protein [Nonomuraea gerenzanensis]|uniref:Uncharacterized protein n=1 Tax=Nonomuraea gerenzanensis TaxID=93944 RepID=A0A1M4E4A6_9ACTN|nr:hypothetical protein [Nonomuraea gerenzanensis]UBU15825.1 hypothetical protein LCN96_12680 [Nonomuraea gerenzanensis]SBO93614.1 hypothetical protein BN4615_P3128 [Nonomuraea gerenzanensis]